ncbi:Putative Mg2+ transporter protein, CorA-like/Zinc transport protein ZntB [Septoria linicola]|uniref:Mg2+ transporter protein, CorA-like/Zinc transport protein ZntB n=1 Tax=Septoria linicola TaxID=215465 RepID=A0A9Q9AX54_9PEZI|nr:putative Mg2+ transporter protein, CorA-like/Zinc transport protein ZntB [Septoria linicola]USW54115.1 Putative Mg2+ transporter protein, CorA-like/Zinc transport protein ZntB [Septoria linicola]
MSPSIRAIGASTADKADYLAELRSLLGGTYDHFLRPLRPRRAPVLSFTEPGGEKWLTCKALDQVLACQHYLSVVERGVIVLSDIDETWVDWLGARYDMDPQFFVHHLLKRERGITLNAPRTEAPSAASGFSESAEGFRWWTIAGQDDGDFHIVRPDAVPDHGKQYLSFYRLSKDLHLVLLDRPKSYAHVWSRTPSFTKHPRWQQDSIEHGPSPIEDLYSMICTFFAKERNSTLLACVPLPVTAPCDKNHALGMLCWRLAFAAPSQTLASAALDVDRLGFDAIEKPSIGVLTSLSACRRRLKSLRAAIEMREKEVNRRSWAVALYDGCPRDLPQDGTSVVNRESTTEQYVQLLSETDRLVPSLNDSFQILIGAMAVLDSDANKKQAERATLLTLLAAIYLPLSLATGIFGMNIREINGGRPTWRFVVFAVIILLIPSVLFVIYLFNKSAAKLGLIKVWSEFIPWQTRRNHSDSEET